MLEEEMLLREFFLRRFNLLHPLSWPSASVSQPWIVSERERDGRLMMVMGGGVIGGSDDGDKSVSVTSLS